MVDELANRAKKYSDALSGERFAAFSLIGTEDWEDYASLSFRAMQAEALADMDGRIEQLSETTSEIERHLRRIVSLLESQNAGSVAKEIQPGDNES